MGRAELPVRTHVADADRRARVRLPELDGGPVARRLCSDTAYRYRGIETQLAAGKPADDGHRGAGLDQAAGIDERQDLEVGFAHGLRDRRRFRQGRGRQVCDLLRFDDHVLDIEVAEVGAWQ